MIYTEAYKTFNFAHMDDIKRIENAVFGANFLMAIGGDSSQFQSLDEKLVVKDFRTVSRIMLTQDMWVDEALADYAYFVGVIGEGLEEVHQHALSAQGPRQSSHPQLTKSRTELSNALTQKIDAKISQFDLRNTNPTLFNEFETGENFDIVFHLEIELQINALLDACLCGGVSQFPLLEGLLDYLERGSFACGWLGPYMDEGGIPKESLCAFLPS